MVTAPMFRLLLSTVFCITILLASAVATAQIGSEISSPPSSAWTLVWADEFEGQGLPNANNWSFQKMPPKANNNELQRYVGPRIENARVANGVLTIEARRENYQRANYTSARLTSAGKGKWTYGRIEMRAMMPTGKGVWPAFWLLPQNPYIHATTCTLKSGWQAGCDAWPGCGEIDIMEYVTHEPNEVRSSVHNKDYNFMLGNHAFGKVQYQNAATEFHIYALEWDKKHMEFFVDATSIMRYENDHTGWQTWPFDQDFYILLNIAVGGSLGGKHGIDPTVNSWKYIIDYVRVYQKAH